MNITDWLPTIGIGAMVFISWRQGINAMSSQMITQYKDQVEQLRSQVSDLTTKLGELTGSIKEKDKQIDDLKLLVTNRNPEFEIFMKTMSQALVDGKEINLQAQEYMKQSTDDLHTIKNLLTVQNLDQQLKEKKLKV